LWYVLGLKWHRSKKKKNRNSAETVAAAVEVAAGAGLINAAGDNRRTSYRVELFCRDAATLAALSRLKLH